MGAIKNIRHQEAGRNYRGGHRELWISEGQCWDVNKPLYDFLLSPSAWWWWNLIGACIKAELNWKLWNWLSLGLIWDGRVPVLNSRHLEIWTLVPGNLPANSWWKSIPLSRHFGVLAETQGCDMGENRGYKVQKLG